MIGLVSFSAVLILIFFYLMRPKPFKRVIPSLIFLESSNKKKNMASFFKRFVKDWIFFLQLFIIILLCLATLGITTELWLKRMNKEITFVIDASASSKSYDNGRKLFDTYVDIARKNIGVRNTVILIKNTPEVLATQTNPLNTLRIFASIKPTDSLSNIWDAMMLSSQISEGKIIILSDFSDTNSKDIATAKQLLEAKGFEVELINPKTTELPNLGIINYRLSGEKAVVDIKNYNDYDTSAEIADKKINLGPNTVEQVELTLSPGMNTLRLDSKDSFDVDNILYINIPEESEKTVLFITNKRNNNLYSALTSMDFLDVKKAEPPIIPDENYDLFVLSDVDYSAMLPGTLDKIRQKVNRGSTLIITAQDNLIQNELLPINIISDKNQEVTVFNNRLSNFEDFNFGLSSKYIEASLKDNSSVVIAETNDKQNSPIIVVSSYGSGKVLYYGIIDDYNSFKISTQYPLFWITSLEYLIAKQDYKEVNKKIGEIIYGDIRDPDNKRIKDYTTLEKVGIYKVDNKEIAVNLLSAEESDLNSEVDTETVKTDYEKEKVLQKFDITVIIVILAMLFIMLELYLIKRRGDI